jgi:hypothetical protein
MALLERLAHGPPTAPTQPEAVHENEWRAVAATLKRERRRCIARG